MTERFYSMVRVASGDYLLPSNDLATLWRLRSYLEDGSLEQEIERGVYRSIRGTFWAAWRYSKGSPDEALADDDLLDEDRWVEWSTLHTTRAEAIASALRAPAQTKGSKP